MVAVSGGVDSMVLLHVLHDLAPSQGWQLVVAHLNHQLRGRSSNADERLVRRTAAGLKLPLVAGKVAVKAFARARRLSLEMAARELRHSFLARVARKRRIPVVVLAHHADDQVELFFLRLLRGGGGAGLSGMKWRTPSPSDPEIALVRPLLDLPKAALVAYAAECDVPYREDASNATLDFRRNRIRHELLPLLRRNYQPAVDRILLRVMDISAAEAEFVTQAAAEWLSGEGGRPFGELHTAVQRRCVQLQLLEQSIVPDFDLVERLRTSLREVVTVGPGLSAALDDRGRLALFPTQAPEVNPARASIDLRAGKGEASFGGVKIRWRIVSGKASLPLRQRAGVEYFDADRVGDVVQVRHWQPGDRFQPIGMHKPVKLQDLFTNRKIPRRQRHELAVVTTAGGELVWVEGLRMSERFKLSSETRRRLQWRWKRF